MDALEETGSPGEADCDRRADELGGHPGQYRKQDGLCHRGPGGRHGHGRQANDLRSGRKLSSSDLQLIVLALLADQPSHGYELMKALEEHSHGLYSPSPGMIYPALTYLEEIGYASVTCEGGKKRYTLTESGKKRHEQERGAAVRIMAEMERVGAQTARSREALDKAASSEGGERLLFDELEQAHRELRTTLRENEPDTPEDARRVAGILLRAAADIRGRR